MKKWILSILTLVLLLLPSFVYANDADFQIESNMEIRYDKGDKFVTVEIEYIRKVVNNDYYFPASGEKTFPIPDLLSQDEKKISVEREFKKDSLTVKDSSGEDIDFSVKEDESGLSVSVPNYKRTTRTSPYRIYLQYKTHDYIKVINQNIVLQAPALPKDTEFEIVDESSNTRTDVDYGLEILIDKEVAPLAKIWPTDYSLEDTDGYDKYIFSSRSRIDRNPYLEFGISQIFRFELNYQTPKTDSFIPEKYSEMFSALSTNIFEISLPRYFDETNQRVKIESISPTPTKISRDEEGNIIATFEVDANKDGNISVVGYVWVEQEEFEQTRSIPNITLDEYRNEINGNEMLNKYLGNTKYWQVSDSYIQEEAGKIADGETHLLDLIKADYRYINEKLEYDQSKADSINNRIGAKQALQGEASVCMEYADAMISILRAQGVAARAALGYANLRDASETTDSQVRHQWVQIWVPNYGWLSVDPTWESENMNIGPGIDRVLWETFNGDDLSNTKIYSADSLDSINNIQFDISVYSVEENDIDDMDALKSYEEIGPIEENTDESSIADQMNKFIKASSIGRSIAIVVPIFLVLIALIIIIAIIRAVIQALKKRRHKETV
ncbi:MAG: transglutaminase-like family protein [candidate division WS6 bacterium 34_10]|uniref:Transglutaminase-like family protein n=1 Tax=candidate division WS6 bacterium 34_10 TaxID=1641389 RepID=A0A124FX77_9BACT|nr:MAG: transglutaminase-like family protein [candidate division WS6 bacterium 34_10]